MLQPVFICNYECRVFSLAYFPLTDPSPSQEISGVGGTGITLTQRNVLCWAGLSSQGLPCHMQGWDLEGCSAGGGRRKDIPQEKDVTPWDVTQQALPRARQDRAVPGGWQGLTLLLHGLLGGSLSSFPIWPPFPKFTSHFVLALRGGRDNGY